jgi:hypothetical protein
MISYSSAGSEDEALRKTSDIGQGLRMNFPPRFPVERKAVVG